MLIEKKNNYEVLSLKIDTERLGKEYLDFRNKLGHKTDDKRNIDLREGEKDFSVEFKSNAIIK